VYKILKIFVFLTLFLSGCAPTLNREGYTLNDNEKTTTDCKITVSYDQNIKGKKIGKLKIGDSGFSVGCSEADALKILKDEGCKIGADIVVLKDIQQPDFLSSCYRVTGEFIKSDSTSAEVKESLEYSPQLVDSREKNNAGLRVLGFIIGFAIGFSITYFLFSHH
jgi:hypothetical protein